MHYPSELTPQVLEKLLAEMPDDSAHSILVIYKKLLHVVLNAQGHQIRLELRLKVDNKGPRRYKSRVGVYCYGNTKLAWSTNDYSRAMDRSTAASQLIRQWSKFSGLLQHETRGRTIIDSTMQGFEYVSTALKKCPTCARIYLPVNDRCIDCESANVFFLI